MILGRYCYIDELLNCNPTCPVYGQYDWLIARKWVNTSITYISSTLTLNSTSLSFSSATTVKRIDMTIGGGSHQLQATIWITPSQHTLIPVISGGRVRLDTALLDKNESYDSIHFIAYNQPTVDVAADMRLTTGWRWTLSINLWTKKLYQFGLLQSKIRETKYMTTFTYSRDLGCDPYRTTEKGPLLGTSYPLKI